MTYINTIITESTNLEEVVENGIVINLRMVTYVGDVKRGSHGTYEYIIGILGTDNQLIPVFSTLEKATKSRNKLIKKFARYR